MPHTWHDGLRAGQAGAVQPISIHMPHTWHDFDVTVRKNGDLISIHMPHTWHDVFLVPEVAELIHFNPHATYVA